MRRLTWKVLQFDAFAARHEKGPRTNGTVTGSPSIYGIVAYFDTEGNKDCNSTTASAVPDRHGNAVDLRLAPVLEATNIRDHNKARQLIDTIESEKGKRMAIRLLNPVKPTESSAE